MKDNTTLCVIIYINMYQLLHATHYAQGMGMVKKTILPPRCSVQAGVNWKD